MWHSITQVYLAYEYVFWMGFIFAALILVTETISDNLKRR